ncbi:zinc finger protein 786-like [Hylaeus volcanicus]|uniref:zinc finger protein 786-like n=1 Tax=Hylaeus volcanicus TaxID=313075 RepID=UPI0023B7B13C|nr:zinc finger protein 786-like [Hylaeus volcanicus]
MRETVPLAGFPAESHPRGMRQRACFQVFYLRQEVQAQTSLDVARQMRARQREETVVVFPVRQAIHVEGLAEEAPSSRVRQGSHFPVSDNIPDFKFVVVKVACPSCEKFFKNHYQLRLHQQQAHSQKRLMDCYFCEESFTMKKSLLAHMASAHPYPKLGTKPLNPLKPWWCFQCGRQYVWRGSLKNHLRIECGKEPTFSCPVCGRRFLYQYRCKSHARLIHGINI